MHIIYLLFNNSKISIYKYKYMYMHTILAISTGKSSLTGRAPICGFGWFGSSPKFYPLYKIYSYKGVYIIIIGLELEFTF